MIVSCTELLSYSICNTGELYANDKLLQLTASLLSFLLGYILFKAYQIITKGELVVPIYVLTGSMFMASAQTRMKGKHIDDHSPSPAASTRLQRLFIGLSVAAFYSLTRITDTIIIGSVPSTPAVSISTNIIGHTFGSFSNRNRESMNAALSAPSKEPLWMSQVSSPELNVNIAVDLTRFDFETDAVVERDERTRLNYYHSNEQNFDMKSVNGGNEVTQAFRIYFGWTGGISNTAGWYPRLEYRGSGLQTNSTAIIAPYINNLNLLSLDDYASGDLLLFFGQERYLIRKNSYSRIQFSGTITDVFREMCQGVEPDAAEVWQGDNEAVRMSLEEAYAFVTRNGNAEATAEIDVASKTGWCRFKATIFRGTPRYSAEVTTIYRDVQGRLELLRSLLPNLVLNTPLGSYEIINAKALRTPTETLMPILSLLNERVPIKVTLLYPITVLLIIVATLVVLVVVMEVITLTNDQYISLYKGVSVLLHSATQQHPRTSNWQWFSYASQLHVQKEEFVDGVHLRVVQKGQVSCKSTEAHAVVASDAFRY
jgi:hypothetical protein